MTCSTTAGVIVSSCSLMPCASRPGRIIQTIKRCGSSNPVIILDEVDKVTVSNHGDPSSALLEVLDPEQNTTFHDNYIDMEYDLSKVLFIATANNVGNIAPALRDRMEMINIPGYLVEEKVRIAPLDGLDDPARHGADVGAAVSADLRLVVQAAQRDAGYTSAHFCYGHPATGSIEDLGFRPVLEVLNPDTLGSDGMKVVTLDLGGGKLGGSSEDIQIIVKTGSTFTAPASDGLNRPDENTGSYFMW